MPPLVTMLTDNERDKLQYVLEHAPSMIQGCRVTLATSLPHHIRPQLLDNGSCAQLVKNAILICEGDQYSVDPPSLSSFLNNISGMVPNETAWLVALANRYATRPTPSDPFLDLVVRGDLPFLNREQLRQALRLLLGPAANRLILTVSGPRYCGKSFTFWFIDHLCRSNPGLRHCYVGVPEGEECPTILHVARDMMTKLGGDPDRITELVEKLTNDRRWPAEVANTLWAQVSEGRNWTGSWLFMLDGFHEAKFQNNTVRLDPHLRPFVLKLAELIRTGVAMRQHRLILIDVDETILVPLQQNMYRQTLSPMTRDEVRAEVLKLLTLLNRADADILANEIMGKLPNAPIDLEDLRDVGTHCSTMLESILAP